MEPSIGRGTPPTTERSAPESPPHAENATRPTITPDVRRRVRDVPPAGYDTGALTDPEATGPIVDPLDPHKPGPGSGDPLDPDGP